MSQKVPSKGAADLQKKPSLPTKHPPPFLPHPRDPKTGEGREEGMRPYYVVHNFMVRADSAVILFELDVQWN